MRKHIHVRLYAAAMPTSAETSANEFYKLRGGLSGWNTRYKDKMLHVNTRWHAWSIRRGCGRRHRGGGGRMTCPRAELYTIWWPSLCRQLAATETYPASILVRAFSLEIRGFCDLIFLVTECRKWSTPSACYAPVSMCDYMCMYAFACTYSHVHVLVNLKRALCIRTWVWCTVMLPKQGYRLGHLSMDAITTSDRVD